MQERGSHSTLQLGLAPRYAEIIPASVHAPWRWWHFLISVALPRIAFPSFSLDYFIGFNGKIKKKCSEYFNLSACILKLFPPFQEHHVCTFIYFNSDTSMTNWRRKKKKRTACTKCATACHKSTPHKLDQLFSSCHEHTAHSVDSEPMHSCCCFCTAILMCHHRAARKAQLASSVLSGIPSTCSGYSGDADTDARVQPQLAGWRQNATILQKQSLIVWLCCSSEETWLLLFCRAEACFSCICVHINTVCARTICSNTYGRRHTG